MHLDVHQIIVALSLFKFFFRSEPIIDEIESLGEKCFFFLKVKCNQNNKSMEHGRVKLKHDKVKTETSQWGMEREEPQNLTISYEHVSFF